MLSANASDVDFDYMEQMVGDVAYVTNSNRSQSYMQTQGYINKEIAERLNIGLTTVITHRKNIQDKLGMKSVSALTIYAVMHGFVDINKI